MNKENVIELLENVAKPICKIEVDLKMPINTLQKAIKGERLLPKKWAIALKHYVEMKMYLLGNKPKVTPPPKKELPKDDDNKQENAEDWTKLSRLEQMKRLRK